MIWICSNRGADDSMWHLAVQRESRGLKTGRVFSTYFVAACTGRQLGGAWGQTKDASPTGQRCQRCEKIALKK